MQSKRRVHERIRAQIQRALGDRSWSWLARTAGIPISTLTDQMRKPGFDLYTLMRVAEALDCEIQDLLPADEPEVDVV